MPYVPKSPCVHTHLNGAPCRHTAYTMSGLCGLHRSGDCTECESMMTFAAPARGWVREGDNGKL